MEARVAGEVLCFYDQRSVLRGPALLTLRRAPSALRAPQGRCRDAPWLERWETAPGVRVVPEGAVRLAASQQWGDASLLGRTGRNLAKEIPGAGTVPAAARAALGSGQSPSRRARAGGRRAPRCGGCRAGIAAGRQVPAWPAAASPCGRNGLLD